MKENKKKLAIRLDLDIYSKLVKKAENNMRSINNEINYILKQNLKGEQNG